MIKDAVAKLLLIPLLGFSIAYCTLLPSFSNRRFSEMVLSVLFWIVVTFFLWQGVVAITAFIRNHSRTRKLISLKIFLLLICTAAAAALIASFAVSIRHLLFQNPISATDENNWPFAYLAIAPIIGLSYEILFLKKEQELDSKVVAQLDQDRQSAELQALTNELDPHFIFNALNVLSPLISTNAAKAQVFTIKLAQTYKYLLRNKDRELIPLQEELHFIQDYFFLLQIRHEAKLQLEIKLNGLATSSILILPFALQALVENAIKHNQFSDEKPLHITITLTKQFIQISNTNNPKHYSVESTNVGLKNLSARYKLICNKDIIVYHTQDIFLVKLPFVKATA
jgi:two-component system, LytTR family, sensor kinase